MPLLEFSAVASRMGDTSLASLSLTHVHYVRPLLDASLYPGDLCVSNTRLEPWGPNLLHLRMARPGPSGAMCGLCHADMVFARG